MLLPHVQTWRTTIIMRLLDLVAALPLLALTQAAPLAKRALSENDISVLKLANTLEYLEQTLYSGGYNKFSDAEFTADGFPAGFRDNVGIIAEVRTPHNTQKSKAPID